MRPLLFLGISIFPVKLSIQKGSENWFTTQHLPWNLLDGGAAGCLLHVMKCRRERERERANSVDVL